MKKTVIGILAHVDAGKTTLAESMLYLCGNIRQLGRVDHGNTFLDYDKQERDRGITIFSSQAMFDWKDTKITLIDTPGHSDFSTEMERTLQILDYAIVVINGLDGVQVHTKTIWQLLQHYQIPTFIFVNKIDNQRVDQKQVLQDLLTNLDSNCTDFSNVDTIDYEKIALTKESYLDNYLEYNTITTDMIKEAIYQRDIFPCFFGSALKMVNINTFLDGITKYTINKVYPSEFGAKVYKNTMDEQGNNLTHIKITGGHLTVKTQLLEDQKVDQIRVYSGTKYEVVNTVEAGDVCAIKGLKNIVSGQNLGMDTTSNNPIVSPFMNYRIVLPDRCDCFSMLHNLQQLVLEDPQLHICYHEQSKEITIQLMGEIQIEILKNRIKARYDIDVDFDQGSIVYKETIKESVVGVGHYEPLRHYAEVHLLLEPGKLGSGLQFFTDCKEEILSRQYQRLILSHLQEKKQLGVLTGSAITDMKITVIAGKAHNKHTEGGDFREATYRAIRQGLKSTTNVLLEPYYRFILEVPNDCLSKAIYDIEKRNGQFTMSDANNEVIVISGTAPISLMQNYYQEVLHYTKGRGKFICSLDGYKPCLNQQAIIDQIGYDSESDIENPTGSIFCSHGAGYTVRWNEVYENAHIKGTIKKEVKEKEMKDSYQPSSSEEKELERIFTSTYGTFTPRLSSKETYEKNNQNQQSYKPLTQCLLVDGYNIIHAWSSLKQLAGDSLDAARSKLLDFMCNYQGYKNCILIVVFDGYKVKGNLGHIEKYHNIYVAYTKEAQTADMYIESATHKLADSYHVVVATSDALEQLIVVGHGAHRISARELEIEMEHIGQEILDEFNRKNKKDFNYPLENIKDINKE